MMNYGRGYLMYDDEFEVLKYKRIASEPRICADCGKDITQIDSYASKRKHSLLCKECRDKEE